MAEALDNLEVQYTYHIHEGSAGTVANGCYTQKGYHSHTSSCYSKATCTATLEERISAGKIWCGYTHSACGQAWAGIDWKDNSSGYGSSHERSYTHQYDKLSCGKTTSTVTSYTIGCGKTTETIESATIIF